MGTGSSLASAAGLLLVRFYCRENQKHLCKHPLMLFGENDKKGIIIIKHIKRDDRVRMNGLKLRFIACFTPGWLDCVDKIQKKDPYLFSTEFDSSTSGKSECIKKKIKFWSP